MNQPRPEIRWPLHVTAWCFIAAVHALKTDAVLVPLLAVLMVVAVWGDFFTSKPAVRTEA